MNWSEGFGADVHRFNGVDILARQGGERRGYGDSAKPPGATDHADYSKREMATDAVALMSSLGRDAFFPCGHDAAAASRTAWAFRPLGLWQAPCESRVSGQAVPSGHFIPEELARETADALASFFREGKS